MFTGLVEETAKLISLTPHGQGHRLLLDAQHTREGLALGDSLACDGCCLTVTSLTPDGLAFDLLDETLRLTTLGQRQPGDLINLERSLAANARLGGHFVTGHIDGTGEVITFEQRGANYCLQIRPPATFLRYLVYKGSVAINGVSLTVAEVADEHFTVWLIPHTLTVTNLHRLKPGHHVNLEFDILAKYVERIQSFPPAT